MYCLCRLLTGCLFAALTLSAAAANELTLAPREPLTRGTLMALLEAELPQPPGGRRLAPVITAPALPLANPADRPIVIGLEGLVVDEANRRVRGELIVRVDGVVTGVVPLEARVQSLIAVPVPSRPIREGELLEPGLLVSGWVAEEALRADLVRETAEAIGREAARVLPAGRPIRISDLRAPRLVRKGEVVTLVYQRGPIEITTLGRALNDAGEGEPVRAVNLASERPVRGVVVGRKLVRVGAVGGAP